MQLNPKYKGIALLSLKRVESVDARYIGKIEKKALSFLKACLVIEPSSRISVEGALNHPYLS
jgi:cyclin-dependent kinase-like